MSNMNHTTTIPAGTDNLVVVLDEVQGKTDPISNEALRKFHVVMTGFWILICVTGICTNVINLQAFVRMGLEDSVTVSFFVLAISDFNICSIAFVEILTFLCAVLEREFNLWFYLPPLVPTFLLMCVRRIFNTTTILITTFLALQRCLCVALPFHVKGMFTRFRTCVFMVTIFAFSIICYSLFIWRHRVVPMLNVAWNATQLKIFVPAGSGPYLLLMEVVLGVGLNMACQLSVLMSLLIMGVVLRRSMLFRQSATSASTAGSNKENPTTTLDQAPGKPGTRSGGSKESQAIVQVALVSTIFVVTNMPYMGFGIANLLIPEFGIHQEFNNLYEVVHNVMFTAEILNSSVNFVVYYKYNTKFRKCCFNRTRVCQ